LGTFAVRVGLLPDAIAPPSPQRGEGSF
jgi:hypothetical protein